MIAVVSGLPRSGTSLMMQMIVAGGLPALTDGVRTPDENNPKGYFEWEPAKALKDRPEAMAEGEGKVVKIISKLLPVLPRQYDYRIVFMLRPLEEVIASQNKMLERLGKTVPPAPTAAIFRAFEKHLKEVQAWFSTQSNVAVLYVEHASVLADGRAQAARVAEFLGCPLHVDRMASQVERSLHREKISVPRVTST
jgi:hypothetical protein